jgi:hypothetical protein
MVIGSVSWMYVCAEPRSMKEIVSKLGALNPNFFGEAGS